MAQNVGSARQRLTAARQQLRKVYKTLRELTEICDSLTDELEGIVQEDLQRDVPRADIGVPRVRRLISGGAQ